MVFETLRGWLIDQCGCEAEDVEMAASLDDLNVLPFERENLSLLLEEKFGISIPTEAVRSFETVEDMVGYVEDRM